jgi:hypothetical protein
MGGMRYGGPDSHKFQMSIMQEKFNEYLKTGNYEMLVDLVNLCAVEVHYKTHPEFHFEAKDRT